MRARNTTTRIYPVPLVSVAMSMDRRRSDRSFQLSPFFSASTPAYVKRKNAGMRSTS